MKNFDKLLNSWKTVFRYSDIRLLLWVENLNTLKWFTRRAVAQNLLKKVAGWIYWLLKYDSLELAATLKKNSYISLETVLQREWVIFQDYSNTITLVSSNTFEREIEGKHIQFFKIKNSILLNPLGIEYNGKYLIASKERAICDRVYLTGSQHFDHLESVDWKKLGAISHIYNTTTISHINNLIEYASNR